jgi:hypothetical protein
MDLKDRFMELLLVEFDRLMDIVTCGDWSAYQENRTWRSEIKIKKEQ